MKALEDGHGAIHIRGIERIQARSPDDIMAAIETGNKARVTEATGANDTSSRSHAIIQIELKVQRLISSFWEFLAPISEPPRRTLCST